MVQHTLIGRNRFSIRKAAHDRNNREGIEKVLSVPALSASWRESFEKLRVQLT